MQNNTVAFYTLGCKLNFSETSAIARDLKKLDYNQVPFEQGADVYIINTCSVTDHADRKCAKVVKQAKKHNPNAFIAIIGCYAQLKPNEISKIPGVNLVLGAQEKFNIAEHLKNKTTLDKKQVISNSIELVTEFKPAYSLGDRTRTFLKVQDGCNYTCSFCTIPLARGGSRSSSIADVVNQAQKIASYGTKEIVLTGVNIGDFGLSTTDQGRIHGTFEELIQTLDQKINIPRFRISSIEPNLLTNEIIEFVAKSKRFVPHFHIPLQSGSDTILKAMRRRYLTHLYANRINQIKQLMPDCCIGVDVIVGFPGETDKLFDETYQFLENLPISYLHVFTFSERPNTHAISLKGKVNGSKKAERNQILTNLSEKKRDLFYKSQLGKTFDVLFEHEKHAAEMHGFTQNYVKVSAPFDPLWANEIKQFKLKELNNNGFATGYEVL